MTYEQAVHWLYNAVPNFQRDGGTKAYKIGLEGPLAIWEHLGFPGKDIKTIHIAGTNGKGSSAHMLSACLQQMGFRVGIFSSPHIFDFRERAKIGTQMVPESFVLDWVQTHQAYGEEHGHSFFELSFMLSMSWFEAEQVDWIVLETGMGGRLDATNVCQPDACLITNIGLDHKEWLGTSRELIAQEKAGIIKPGVPVVMVERDSVTEKIGVDISKAQGAPLFWAQPSGYVSDLKGAYQEKNIDGVVSLMRILYPEYEPTWSLGLEQVVKLTGLFGRWTLIQKAPRVFVDTAHNLEAWKMVIDEAKHVLNETAGTIHWVFGCAKDKELGPVFALFPKNSQFYFTSCSSNRCRTGKELAQEAGKAGIEGTTFEDVGTASESAKAASKENDIIVITGSNFVVADLRL